MYKRQALIIEDERHSVVRLEKMVAELAPDLEIVGHATSISAAVEMIKSKQRLQLLFLDIQLEDGEGFEVLKQSKTEVPVIFVTGHQDFALRAFREHSRDYLLKPIVKVELERALQKVRKFNHTETTAVDYQKLMEVVQGNSTASPRRFLTTAGKKIITVPIKEVVCFYADEGFVYLARNDGQQLLLNQTLEKLAHELSRDQFYRVNRKVIVNVDFVAGLKQVKSKKWTVEMSSPIPVSIPVPTEKLTEFKDWLRT